MITKCIMCGKDLAAWDHPIMCRFPSQCAKRKQATKMLLKQEWAAR